MMGTAVSIHVIEPPCTEEMVRRFLGLGPQKEQPTDDGGDLARLSPEERHIVRTTPGVEAGASDYFAEQLDRLLGFPPERRKSVHSLFRRRPLRMINEALVATVAELLQAESDPRLGPAKREEVLAFLRGHLGKLAFAALWDEEYAPLEPLEGRPKTVAEAVDVILSWLSDEEKEAIRRNEPCLAEYHFTLGLRIRNELGLWGRNPELEEALTAGELFYHIDDLSYDLLQEVQKRLRAERA